MKKKAKMKVVYKIEIVILIILLMVYLVIGKLEQFRIFDPNLYLSSDMLWLILLQITIMISRLFWSLNENGNSEKYVITELLKLMISATVI